MAMLFSVMSFATDVTISFANADQRVSHSTSSHVWQNSGVTFTNDKSASTNDVVNNTNPIRCYASSKITVEAPGNITKLVFDCNNGSYATALKNSVGNEASVSNDIVTITPTSASDTYVIAKLTAQVRIDKLTVTYTESGAVETVVANPVFSLAGGEYEGAQTLKISCTTADATIYYTTNGEVPSTSSNVYSDPITISENTTIKAYAVKNGLEDSEVVEAIYTITEGPDAIIDFTSNDAWKFPTEYDKTEKTYSDGTYTVVVNAASNGHKYSGSQLLLGKKDAYLVLPAFSQPIEKIACPAVSGSSGKVTWNIYDGANAVSKEVTACNIDQVFKIDNPAANKAYTIKITNDNNLQISHIKIYFGEAAAVTKPYINGDAEFIESTEVTISAEDGLKVYYTLDGTDPTNASTEYTAPFTVTATTTVKAVAYDGETASEVSSKTFKAITLLTCKEAAELALSVANNNDLVPNGPYAFRGFVTNIAYAYQTGGTMSVWMADTKNGGKVMQAYKFTPEDGNNPPVVGDYLQVVGELTKYNTTPESAAGAIVTKYPAPVVNHTINVSANPAEGGVVTGGGEYEETDEITVKAVANEGYEFVNWTENEVEVSTDAEYTFAVLADRNLVANFKVAEPVIEWIEMELEIANLTTEVMEVGGKKYLQLNGRNDMEDADVTLFLNDYADADGDYVVNTETAYLTYGGLELTVIEGVMTQTTDVEKGAIYTGTVRASVTDEEEGGTMYLEFALTMYAAPAVELVLTDAIVAFIEKTGVLTFNVSTGEGEGYYVELAGYTAPGVHEGPQICLLTTPEVIAYATYVETEVVDGVITLKGEFTSPMGPKFDLTISGKLPVAEEPVEIVGVVKRALQIGESTIILTHEADGTAHIYNVIDEEITEISQEGVVAVDPENAGDLLAISDIALTEDGKLLAINKIVCQAGDGQVDAGYKRGETRVYIWNDLAGAPSVWFTSKMSSNWYRSVQGHTMAYKGTSINGTLFTTGVTATGTKFRYSVYNVIDGVYTDPAVNDSEYYHYTKGSAQETTNVGANYELNVSPLAANTWVLDGELINPFEITDPLTYNTEVTAGATLNEDLGKKYNGASYVTVGEQVLMVAPYAAEDKLAGVKVLDITSGLATATVVATADLDAAVEATAAATAVAVAENVLTITLVGDATMHLLDVELEKGPATALENIAVEGKAVKAIINGQLVIIKNGVQYNAQGAILK